MVKFIYRGWTMKLKHLVLYHKNLLVWCKASFCGQYSISSFWERPILSSSLLHSGQRDFEPIQWAGGGKHFLTCSYKIPQKWLQNI